MQRFDTNITPYFDDFDDSKNYHRILFKPGYPVQARELTQIQTILQNQIGKFGNNIFKNGSLVTGGQFFFQKSTYLKLDSTYSNIDVNISEFENQTIFSLDGSKRAEVVKVYDIDPGTSEPKTLMVKQVFGSDFIPGETIKTSSNLTFANISTGGVGTGLVFSINEGVFYYEEFFVKNLPQTIAVSKYSTNVDAKIGFEVNVSAITSEDDSSLLDPALYASNYLAPGADRIKIELVLSTRTLDSIDESSFVLLAKVQNGVIVSENKYPMYAVLEDTLARRTYDESGNYTVKPFNLSIELNPANTAQTNIILSPGKAYVYGYEYETNGPTIINVDNPRSIDNASNRIIAADYGNFVYTINHKGSLPTNSLETVDLHCVNLNSINVSSVNTINNTKIGTCRIKAVDFDGASNTSNSSTYQYKTFIFDTNVSSITGNVNGTSTASEIKLYGGLYSTVANAYTGAILRITSGLGSDESPKTIIGYNGTTQTINVSPSFITTPNSKSLFSIDFDFSNVESFANFNSTTLQNGSDISNQSKDQATIYNNTIITDSIYEPLIFPLDQIYIAKNSISDMSFKYQKLYQNQTFNASLSPALTLGTGESIASATSTSAKAKNYYITVVSQGTSPYSTKTIIPADKFTVDTGTNKITVVNGNDMVANIVATIEVSNTSRKDKVYNPANTVIQTSGGIDVYGNTSVISYPTNGQCHIKANTVVKTPGITQSLFVSDVLNIVKILDYNNTSITEANTLTAINVTNNYTFDNGQRDTYYDHASIKLKPGTMTPVGPMVVFYNCFTSSGAGFFTVDSYSSIDYKDIPIYSSSRNNSKFNLRDCLDFRAVRLNATTGSGSNIIFDVDQSTTGPKIPVYGSDITLDYSYYLARIDKIIVDKSKKIDVLLGAPAINPLEPKDTDTSMTIFTLKYPPYVADIKDVLIRQISNKRYTMRDVGALEKRIENLEYYTSLSLLELDTVNKQDLTILDSQNLPRFKNGIVVDSFVGHSVAAVMDNDYKAAIDPIDNILRPSFDINSCRLTFDSANSSNYTKTGSLVTIKSNNVILIDQPKSSKIINVNPFNVLNFLGKIKMNPSSDIWVDTNKQPDVIVNHEGNRDAWAYISNQTYSYEWNSWQTVWTGVTSQYQTFTDTGLGLAGVHGMQRQGYLETTTVVTTRQTRTGILSRIVPKTITTSMGTRIIDVSIIPYMRNINILFVGTDFKPITTLYPYFDNSNVEKWIGDRVNKIYLANTSVISAHNSYVSNNSINLNNQKNITIKNTTTNTSNGTATVVHIANDIVYLTDVNPITSFNFANSAISYGSGFDFVTKGYEHNGGKVVASTSNSITLQLDAKGALNESTYIGSELFIVKGKGAGISGIIIGYDTSTRVATISGNWSIQPDTTSYYGIGKLKTDTSGSVVGIFNIPEGIFRTGEKLFRLTDNPYGDLPSSSTSGDVSFYAQGTLQTTQETILSTLVPEIQRTLVTDSRVLTDVNRSGTTIYYDPLAETFLISPQQFPEGVYLSKVRFCFKSKDDILPVTLQIRPTVNGYPSSSVIYPYSTVSLTPDKVKISETPSLDTENVYTDFVFESPVYIQPGEHSFVLLSNSNKYEVYAAEIGKKDLVSGQQISDQAYGGSLFMSQNGSTWTADQNSDLMFRIYRCEFNNNDAIAQFIVDKPASNISFNAVELLTSQIVTSNTSLNHQYSAELENGGFTSFMSIVPDKTQEITDSFGTRILNTVTGNTTFILNSLLMTENSQISPVIDTSRIGLILVKNRINNLELSNADIVISNSGSGYVNTADINVIITGGGGSGATAIANVKSNVINAVYITNGGNGYTSSPTITLIPSSGGTGAVVKYNGETEKSGGNAIARYITRRITLNDGFDSSDLRVYLTANKPVGTGIFVYCKLLSASDIELFEDKSWILLTEIGNSNFISTSKNDYRELLFAPGVNGVPDNHITYTSGNTAYSTFKTFAIKIVMTSQSEGIVPKIKDFRAIALPAG